MIMHVPYIHRFNVAIIIYCYITTTATFNCMGYMRTMLVTDLPIQYNYACIYQLISILTNTLTNNEVIILLQISSHRLYDHHKHLILYITEQIYACS